MSANELGYIHRFEPAAQPGSAPTLVLLHGTGGDESDLIPLGQMIAPGAALLSPRGNVPERGANRFFRRLAEGVFDIDDLIRRTHDLADFILAAAQAYGFDPQKVVAVGYSNGANIAASTLLLRPDVLAGAVLYHPQVPLDPPAMPDLRGKAVFIGAGRFDQLVPTAQTERLAALLQQAGANVTTSWQTGDHALTRAEVEASQQWLQAQPWFAGA